VTLFVTQRTKWGSNNYGENAWKDYVRIQNNLTSIKSQRSCFAELPPSPPYVSDYALVRRQFHIFERALKKFKSDVGLWVQYAQVAKREGARALVGRITARYITFMQIVQKIFTLKPEGHCNFTLTHRRYTFWPLHMS